MRSFTLSEPEPVEIGGVVYATADLTVAEELEWNAIHRRLMLAEAGEDDINRLTALVQKCVPDFDVSALSGSDLVRLGRMLIKGADVGNASGAATTSTTSQPSSPAPTASTTETSSRAPRKRSESGRTAPTA